MRIILSVSLLVLSGSLQSAQQTTFGQDTVAEDATQTLGNEKKPLAAFSGMIMGEDGLPVDDATISLQGKSYYRTQTDDFGVFAFLDDIETGEYRVRIESGKYLGLTDFRKLPSVSITQDEPGVENFVLKRACQIELTVVDEQGDPVQCSVYYSPLTSERYTSSQDGQINAEGVGTLGGLDPAMKKYQIGVHSRAHAIGRLVIETGDPNKIEKHRIVLRKGKSVVGKVMCSDGLPASGWRVWALPSWWNFGVYPGGPEIGDDGHVELPNIGNEPYDLTVSIPSGGGMSTSRPLVAGVNLHEAKQPLEWEFDHPSPKSMQYLSGTIRWIGKERPDGVRISGYASATRHFFNHIIKEGEDEFRVGPIPKGVYRITIENSEVEVMNSRKDSGLNDLSSVLIPNEEKLQVVLRFRGNPVVRATVTDAETGKPIERFKYLVRKIRTTTGPNYVPNGDWSAATDGKLESEVVGPGVYVISVLADNYAHAVSAQVNTDEQPDRVLSVKLNRGVPFTGQVIDSAGKPVDNAKIRLLSLNTGAYQRASQQFVDDVRSKKTADGFFEFKNLVPGKETIRIDHPNFPVTVFSDVEIGEDNQPREFVLPKGGSISGTVYDNAGKPLANEVLHFSQDFNYSSFDGEDARSGQAITDASGRYSVDKLPAGEMHISRANYWDKTGVLKQKVMVTDGKTLRVDLGGKTVVSGTIFNAGKPLANCRLQLTGTDSVFDAMKYLTTTDASGAFTLHGAPRGNWRLYRELEGSRSDWAPILAVDITNQNQDLGRIDLVIGTLTVNCRYSDGESVKAGTRAGIREYSTLSYFGRDVGTPSARTSDSEPFVFNGVSSGTYELYCYDNGVNHVKRIELDESNINGEVDFVLPRGDSSLAFKIIKPAEDTEDDRASLKGVTVTRAVGQQETIFYVGISDSDNVCRMSGLPPGEYSIKLGNLRTAEIVATVSTQELAESQDAQVQEVEWPEHGKETAGNLSLVTIDENGICIPVEVDIPGINASRQMSGYYLSGKQGSYDINIDQRGFEPYHGTVELVPAKQVSKTPFVIQLESK